MQVGSGSSARHAVQRCSVPSCSPALGALPASTYPTRTEIWQRAGCNMATVQGVMEVDEMVDAALVGFDRREAITIPSLQDFGQWETFSAARQAMLPNFRQEHAAARYRA